MRNTLTIAKYELKRLFRDWRLVAMVLSQPIVIALIVGLVAHHEPKNIKILVHNPGKDQYSAYFIDKLNEDQAIDLADTNEFSNDEIVAGKARAIVKIEVSQSVPFKAKIEVKTDPTGSLATIVASQKIAEAASNLAQKLAEDNVSAIVKARQDYLQSQLPVIVPKDLIDFSLDSQSYDPLQLRSEVGTDTKTKYFDYYGSSMMVVLVLLVVLNLSGIAITSERASGTFERLSVTPYRKSDIILGKAGALFLIGVVVNVLGIASSKVLYDINIGNIYLLGLTTILVVAMAVNLGLFVSSVTKNVVESVELAMYVFFVSFLLSGILLPIENAHPAYAWAMKVLPFSHAVGASRNINMLGAGWVDVRADLGIVSIYILVFLLLSIVTLRREAK